MANNWLNHVRFPSNTPRRRAAANYRGRRRHSFLESLEHRYVLDSTAVFNEVLYHPRAEDGPEWIEVHNQQGVNLDISGWRLDGGIQFTFPEGTIMEGGAYLVVSANPATSGIADAMGPYLGRLANNGEEILLRNNNDRVMDSLSYSDDFPWPEEADGTGTTLAKRHVNTASDDPANWTFSAEVGGTPGELNFRGNEITFVNVDFIASGDTVNVHVPTDGTLGTDWTAPDYVLGSQGEIWTSEETSVGFFVGDQGEAYADSVLTDSPLAYWRLSETDPQLAATNLGSLGAAVDGTYSPEALVGAESLVGEAGDHALALSSADSESPFRSPSFEKVGPTGRTIEFWVSVDALPTTDVNLVGDGEGGLDFGMVVGLRSTGQLRVTLRTDVNFVGIGSYDTQQALMVGELVHVVATWDAATGDNRIYLNGVEAVRENQSGSPTTGNAYDTDNAVSVGRDGRNSRTTDAKVDEVAIYDFPLGDDRVSAHYDAGRPRFSNLVTTELTEMINSSSSVYLRKDFTIPANVDLQRITLNMQYDDSFVAYVDGVEVARRNITGAPAFDSTASSGRTFDEVLQIEQIQLLEQLAELPPGTHTLAIHGVNAAVDDDDFLISYSMTGFGPEIPEPEQPVVSLNEISAATAKTFWIELQNDSDEPADLQNYRLVLDGIHPSEYAFPSQNVPAGGLVSFTQADLGFRPANGDALYVYRADMSSVIDARNVTNRLRGRSEDAGDRWLYPDIETPGTTNSFDTNADIVINEILYHPPRLRATPAIIDTIEIAPFSMPWRYNNKGDDLGADWQSTTHAVDNVNWFQGQGPVGRTADDLPVPLGTEWPSLDFFTTTYYFQTEFTYNGIPDGYDLSLWNIIDDGAIIYVNGQEVLRVRMPDGPVTADTRATEVVPNASLDDPVVISDEHFVLGQNTISVELHMAQVVSTEAVMGVAVTAAKFVSPALPVREPGEQWIELYNRGDQPVDLAGWSFSDGINYDFPTNTILPAGEYLVVANNAAELAVKYPTARITGDFGGSLSRAGERIELTDTRGNPVDVVDYRDSGRWDGLADGGGSSLELRDPLADNSVPEAWKASDETDGGTWQTITYRGRATSSSAPTTYNELVLGLLDSGEVLLDDIRVVEDPSGEARQLIQNGDFEEDAIDGAAGAWRIIGTHEQSRVVVDPDDPNNQVLKLVATGTTEHMHNHAETTLKFADSFVTISSSETYEISFRAKWLSGSDQLNSRLYFNRLPRTTYLAMPTTWGTPGSQNTAAEPNIGPTYAGLSHAPTIPTTLEDVIVSIDAADQDGVSSMNLFYAVDGGEFATTAMSNVGGSRYSGVIPAQMSGAIVQFYVEGADGNGATSAFPADGAASRALYVVEDGAASDLGNHNFRIVMTTADADRLHEPTNVMSNARLGATLIYDESEVYYDVGVKLKGSERGRNQNVRVGFNLRFDPLHMFRGVHRTIGIDRSGAGNQYSQKEILVKQTLNHAGGVTDLQDDLIHLIAPRSIHTGSALLQMSRYKDVFLDSQFSNGSDGGLFKYELIYYPTSTTGGPEGLKRPEPDSVTGVGVRARGVDAEDHRWNFLIRNNIAEDDYSGLIRFLNVMGLSGDAFHEQARELLDVDFWLRSFAVQTLWGVGDNYATGAQHNAYFYLRPSDGRALFLPWDVDFSGSSGATSGLSQNGDLNKLLTLPENEHYYYGHIHDIVTTSFNSAYMDPWIDHYATYLTNPNGQDFLNKKSYISTRATYALNTINSTIPTVDFEITTNGGADMTVNESEVTLGGNGWVDVREIRLAGSTSPLDISWPQNDAWQVTLPLTIGPNVFALEAYNLQGEVVGSDSITVTSNISNPVVSSLRISEINYHPTDPTAGELAIDDGLTANSLEFIEFINVGGDTINPVGTTFSRGLTFTFPSLEIAAGERVVVARDTASFQIRYSGMVTPIGEFAGGGLNNAGERLTLVDGTGELVLDFSYNDAAPWPEAADGLGATLTMIDPFGTPADNFGKFQRWRASTHAGGSPGEADTGPVGVVVNELLTNSDSPLDVDAIELFNTTEGAIDIGGWFLSDSGNDLFKFEIPASTILGPGEYLVFDEHDFNPTPATPGPNDFALNGSAGDDVWLVVPDGSGGVLSFVEEVHFGAAEAGLTLGRLPAGSGPFATLARPRLGCENQQVRSPSVLITELNANPGLPSQAALAIEPSLTAADLDFIEIYNGTTETVDLTDWRIRGGADYDFDAGQLIGAGASLVVLTFEPNDPNNASRVNALRAHYEIDESVTLVGGLSGQLSDTGERIDLRRPGTAPDDDPTSTPRISEDLIVYENTLPWPTTVNGTGMSLTRGLPVSNANDSGSWKAAPASPGDVSFDSVLAGDVNGDSAVNDADIDAILDVVQSGRSVSFYDLDDNGVVNAADVNFLVISSFGTSLGDANLDHVVDGADFNTWSMHVFESCQTWRTADFNGDGLTDVRDFNIWNDHSFLAAPVAVAAPRAPRAPLAASLVRLPVEEIDEAFGSYAAEHGMTDVESRTQVEFNPCDGAAPPLPRRYLPRRADRTARIRGESRTPSEADHELNRTRRFESILDEVFGK